MSDSLEFTGERFTPECVREIWYEHFHRYALAARWCANGRTLDAACGEGYGASMLAGTADSVEAIDISVKAIEHARERYGHIKNLNYQAADCTALPFEDSEFDHVVSFETLEHLAGQDQLLAEFRRVLKPAGVLILSSPDKAIYTDKHKTSNEFHVKELYRDELEALIGRHFGAWCLLGQKLVFHSAIWSLAGVETASFDQLSQQELTTPSGIAQDPMYFIALCAVDESMLPKSQGQMWLFDDQDESVYQHYHGEIKRNMAAGGIITGLEQEIEALKTQLELSQSGQSGVSQGSWWQRLLGRN